MMRIEGTLLDVFHFYVKEASRYIEDEVHSLSSDTDCPIETCIYGSGWEPTDVLWNGWTIKYTIIDPIYGDEEWQATHENYDGAPDGNRHLYIHDSSLVNLLNELYELGF